MPERLRRIKSFVLRQGRLTPGQTRALELHWPTFGLCIDDGVVDVASTFPGDGPLHLEIGFGMGDSLAEQARSNPDINYIGIEVHRPGVGHLLMQVAEHDLNNIRVYSEDSIEVLNGVIPNQSLDVVQVFFPDPWPKKKHHKRRIINRDFLALLEQKLKPNGMVHVATDWQQYAEEIGMLFDSLDQYSPVAAPERPKTKFERRGEKLGHAIFDLAFRLVG